MVCYVWLACVRSILFMQRCPLLKLLTDLYTIWSVLWWCQMTHW